MKLNELDHAATYTVCDERLSASPYKDTGAGIVEMCRECFGNEPGFVDPDDDETDYHIEEASSHYLSELSRGWWVSIGSTLLDDSGVTTDDDGNHWHDGSRDDNLYGPFTTEQEARESFDDAPRFEVV